MGANEKLRARYRAREVQWKKNEEKARRDRANAVDAESIRATLHRVDAVDTWERKRFGQAAENIRADAVKRRAGQFRGLQAVVEQMRWRGLTFAQIAELVGVDVREIQTALRRARADDQGKRCATARSRSVDDASRDAIAVTIDATSDGADRHASNERVDGAYDPTRCVRCDAVMLDEDVAPRRGRRRLYCSDTCRRDASAARTAAERFGAPIRVVEVPKASAPQKKSGEISERNRPAPPMDAANTFLDDAEALCELLAGLADQARLRKLDRATYTAARELSKAVHLHRSW
jgi:hypothetical protein